MPSDGPAQIDEWRKKEYPYDTTYVAVRKHGPLILCEAENLDEEHDIQEPVDVHSGELEQYDPCSVSEIPESVRDVLVDRHTERRDYINDPTPLGGSQ
jgi:hypothetical protein